MEYSVRVEGAEQALRALRTLEPTVAREVGREVGKVGVNLAAAIRMIAPTSPPLLGTKVPPRWTAAGGGPRNIGWAPIQTSNARRGMAVRVTTLSNPPAVASFAESLGRGTKAETPAGRHLVAMARKNWSAIVKSGKKEGRVARAAIAAEYPQIMSDLRAACDKATAEVNRRMP